MEVPGEGVPVVRKHGLTGDTTMQTPRTLHRNAQNYLTHIFGFGLDDDRYVVERYESMTDVTNKEDIEKSDRSGLCKDTPELHRTIRAIAAIYSHLHRYMKKDPDGMEGILHRLRERRPDIADLLKEEIEQHMCRRIEQWGLGEGS